MRVLSALVALAALGAVAPAHAATVALVTVGSSPGDPGFRGIPPSPPADLLELRIVADPGEADDLRVDGLRVTATSSLRPGERCRSDAPGSVICEPGSSPSRGAWVRSARLELGDGDDRLAVLDRVAETTVLGGDGADALDATVRDTTAFTPATHATWVGGAGPDSIAGGEEWTVAYRDRTARLDVSLDGVANDGEPGEGDDAGTVVGTVLGGSGNDRLLGGGAPVGLAGGGGDDVLEAQGAARAGLSGGAGADRMIGGPAADSLGGGDGDDVLLGGGGGDAMTPGAGADRSDGGDGDDVLTLDVPGDGAPDVVDAGPGRDLAVWDDPRYPARERIVADLSDDRGPDGAAGERDVVTGAEDVRARVGSFAVTGTDGPNRLHLLGRGAVDARAGDDVLAINDLDTASGVVRIAAGPGRDLLDVGDTARADTRDGEADRIRCDWMVPRSLRLDPAVDRAHRCTPAAYVLTEDPDQPLRVAPGGRIRFAVECTDPYRGCRARVSPRLSRPREQRGRPLPAFAVRVPLRGEVRRSVLLPGDTPPGRRVLRFAIRTASPFAGVPGFRGRGAIRLRVVRPR